jgi:hypothetical protein
MEREGGRGRPGSVRVGSVLQFVPKLEPSAMLGVTALFTQAAEGTSAIRDSRIGKLMTAAAAARAISAYHIH